MSMDIKQRLERMAKAAYGLEGLNVIPDTLAAVCADARAEIERLEGEVKDRDVFLELADTKIALLEKRCGAPQAG